MTAQARIVPAAAPAQSADRRVGAYDWNALSTELNAFGCAVLDTLLTPEGCADLAALYPQEVIGEALIEAELSVGASPLSPPSGLGDEGRKRIVPAAAQIAGDGFDAAMERAVADLFRSFGGANPQVGLYHRVLHDLEAPLIAATLTSTRGNQIKAAEILGLNRNTLRKKIRDLNLRGVASFR